MKRPYRKVVVWVLFSILWMDGTPRGKAFVAGGTKLTRFKSSTSSGSSLASPLFLTVEEMRAEAERVRLEAELMEQRLTLTKIERLEEKLGSKDWLAKHPDETDDLERQLEALQRKLVVEPSSKNGASARPSVGQAKSGNIDISSIQKAEVVTELSANGMQESPSLRQKTSSVSPVSTSSLSPRSTRREMKPDNPICGFDDDDLEKYLPVAKKIEASMGNKTIDEKLIAFRADPDLQEHFKKKIKSMFLEPIGQMQKLEELRSEFLYTRSRVEKENLRRQIAQMEKDMEESGPFGYSESIFANIPPMPDEEMQERLQAVQALPAVLQGLYIRRTKAPDGDIRLAIELDHYEGQVQLLEQIKFVQPWSDALQEEAVQAVESLPMSIRAHIAKGIGLENGADTKTLLDGLRKGRKDPGSEEEWSNLQELVVSAGGSTDEHDDLDYIDRSRYAEEFYPSIARLEDNHPSAEEMDAFLKNVVDRRAFMVRTKPERVVGGWYVRGDNLLSDDEDGTKLVKCLMERLEASKELSERLEFFYVPDPSPLSDEDFEMDVGTDNLLYVTRKDPTTFYNNANGLTKFSVSSLGILSMALFSLASVEMVPALQERLDAAINTGGADFEWLVDTVTPVFLSLLGISVAHDVGHALIAFRDKFKIGFGSPIASIQMGYLGSITPLESPPPSMKSMFDFAMAGPMLGFLASLYLFVTGLQQTAAVDLSTSLDFPGLPIFLLRSSALGGGLIEFILGKGTLLPGVDLPVDSVLPLHPFAIAGFVGIMANALALLPVGNTDGGRISITMFGRRGAYLVSTFTTVLLCIVGLFGFDEARIFLTYTLFALLWQRELETPARNEVEELDFVRGVVGIVAALFVGLTLCPFS